MFPSEKQRARKEFMVLFWIGLYIALYLLYIITWSSTFRSSVSAITFIMIAIVIITVFSFLLTKYLRRIDTRPIVRIIIACVVLYACVNMFFVGALVLVISSRNNNEDEILKEEPSHYTLNLEQFDDSKVANEIRKTDEASIFVKRQMYEEAIVEEDDGDYQNYISTDTVESYTTFIADFIYKRMIIDEKKSFEYRAKYNAESVNVNEHIYEIAIEGLDVESVYVIVDDEETELIIKKGKRIVRVESTYELLDKESIKIIQETLGL